MAPLTTATRAITRCAASPSKAVTTAARALSTTPAQNGSSGASFSSPFRGEQKSTQIPDFKKYMAPKGSSTSNAVFSYFMVGAMGAISAAGAKSTVQGELEESFPLVNTLEGYVDVVWDGGNTVWS